MRWRPRFRLLHLVVLTTIVSMGLGYHTVQCRRQQRAVNEITRLRGRVTYYRAQTQNPFRRWVANTLGPHFAYDIELVTLYPDAATPADEQVKLLAAIPNLPRLAIWPESQDRPTINVNGLGGLTDAGADFIVQNLPDLWHLNTTAAHVSDDGALRLLSKPTIRSLSITRHASAGGDKLVDTVWDSLDHGEIRLSKPFQERLQARER